ncbi:MAG: hypothetical protein KKD77_20185 [Gammaproteobacteria bacterium]|nr:hypothetical protein [Gammaproteobacteria bacterium]
MVSQADVIAAFQAAHTKIIGEKYSNINLTKVVETRDVDGVVTSTAETTDYAVPVIIQSLNDRDRELLGLGEAEPGTLKIFCNPTYDLTNNGSDTTIEPGDKVEFSGENYLVEELIGKKDIGGTEIHRSLLIRRVES